MRFDKRASILVQYGADMLSILAAAWSVPGEPPMSLAIQIHSSSIESGFRPPLRYTVERLQFGVKTHIDQNERKFEKDPSMSARDAVTSGVWGELPLWIGKNYQEVNLSFIKALEQKEELSTGESFIVAVVCKAIDGGQDHVKFMILKPRTHGQHALIHSKKPHPDSDLRGNIAATKEAKFMFVEPTISEKEGTITTSSFSDHAFMIRNASHYVGDDGLCAKLESHSRIYDIQHSCFAYLAF